jgi:hypothetical protein
MPFYRLRMLRNQEGASPGGGASPAVPAATTETTPQAQGAGSASNDLASTLKEFRNGLFADVRGMVEKIVEQKTKGAPAATPTPRPPEGGGQASSSTGLTTEEVNRLMTRRDSLADAIAGYPEATRSFLRDKFAKENPEDVSAWVTGYASAFGIQRGAATTTTTTSTTDPKAANVSGPPISDKGPPAGSREFEQITNPTELTRSDIERLQAKHGEEKANEMIREMARRYLRDKKFVPGGPTQ